MFWVRAWASKVIVWQKSSLKSKTPPLVFLLFLEGNESYSAALVLWLYECFVIFAWILDYYEEVVGLWFLLFLVELHLL